MKVVFPLLALLTFAFQASAQVYQGHVVFRRLFNSSIANTDTPFEGSATLVQTMTGNVSSTTVTLMLRGLQSNRSYGVHIHQWGDLSGAVNTSVLPLTINPTLQTVSTVGGHYDVFGRLHGCKGVNETRHTGDLGNITVAADTAPTDFVTFTLESELLDLGADALDNNSIIGRAIVIHERTDVCWVPPPPGLGAWVAVGTIGIDNVASNMASQEALIPRDPWTFSPKANAVIYNGTDIVGNVWFWTGLGVDGRVRMTGQVSGFAPNSQYGVAIHQYGNVANEGNIGDIFAGATTTHALPPLEGRHWGILGNLRSNAEGDIIFTDYTAGLELISLFNVSGHSIIGRSIAFHNAEETGTAGSAGAVTKWGIIGLAAPNANAPTFEPSPNSAPASAHAVLRAYYNSSIANVADVAFSGTVDFQQSPTGGNVTVTLRVSGLQAGKSYGVHVHTWGDLSAAVDLSTGKFWTNKSGVATVGGHYDVFGRSHGCKGVNETRHTGDVGNLTIPADATSSTVTTFVLESELLDLGVDPDFTNDSIIGRAVVIHELPDICYIPDAGLGAWIGVGVIGLTNTPGNTARQDTLPQNIKANVLVLNASTKAPLGDIQLSTDSNGVIRAYGFVSGFAPNSVHGMHVHVWGNEDNAGTSGPHYSQFLADFGHGLPPSPTRHWGALGNVTVDGNGYIIFNNDDINANLLSLWNPAAHGIIGRILTFHENADNGDPSSYGARLAYGLIGLANPATGLPAIPTDAPATTTAPPTTGAPTTAAPTTNGTTPAPTTAAPTVTTAPTPTNNGSTTSTPTSTPTPTTNPNTTVTPPTTTAAPTSPPSAAAQNQVNSLVMLIAIMCASMCVVA